MLKRIAHKIAYVPLPRVIFINIEVTTFNLQIIIWNIIFNLTVDSVSD